MENTYYLKELLPRKFMLSSVQSDSSILFGRKPDLFRVFVYDSCLSSLDTAWKLIRERRIDPGDSVLCVRQTRGRGRMGREWLSAQGNIMAAWLIPSLKTSICDNLLPLIMGLTLRRAMLNMGLSLLIKWPNDLIHNNRKVGGILIEERYNRLVAGIGLNLVSCPESDEMRESFATEPGHLGEHLAASNPLDLWARLVYLAHFWYNEILCNFSLIDFIQEINSNLWMMGENIRIESEGKLIEGTLAGVGDKGEILVRHPGGIARLTSGSITK